LLGEPGGGKSVSSEGGAAWVMDNQSDKRGGAIRTRSVANSHKASIATDIVKPHPLADEASSSLLRGFLSGLTCCLIAVPSHHLLQGGLAGLATDDLFEGFQELQLNLRCLFGCVLCSCRAQLA